MEILNRKKFKIKKAYEKYKNSNFSNSSQLQRLSKYFFIYLDNPDVKDYSVEIDLQNLRMKLIDKKHNIFYASQYDSEDTVTTKITTPEYFLKTVYSTETFNPIIQICTIDDGNHQLSYTKYHEKKDGTITDRATLNYFLVNGNNRVQDKQSLLFQSHLISRNDQEYQEQKHCDILSGKKAYLQRASKDEDVYIFGDNLLYSVNKQEFLGGIFSGFCLLDSNIDEQTIYDMIPSSIPSRNYQYFLKDKDIKSVMHCSGQDKNGSVFLTIYKTDSNIVLSYERNGIKAFTSSECFKKRIFSIPSFSDGVITADELKLVEEELKTSFVNDSFITLFSNKIESFTSEVEKHKSGENRLDLVEELCRSNDFSRSLNEVIQNKDFYFQRMHDTFIDVSGDTVKKVENKGLVKKPNNKRMGVRI